MKQQPKFIRYCPKLSMIEETIRAKYRILILILRNNVNLSNPEEIKLFLAETRI